MVTLSNINHCRQRVDKRVKIRGLSSSHVRFVSCILHFSIYGLNFGVFYFIGASGELPLTLEFLVTYSTIPLRTNTNTTAVINTTHYGIDYCASQVLAGTSILAEDASDEHLQ